MRNGPLAARRGPGMNPATPGRIPGKETEEDAEVGAPAPVWSLTFRGSAVSERCQRRCLSGALGPAAAFAVALRAALVAGMIPMAACTVGPDFTEPELTVNPAWLAADADLRSVGGPGNRDWWRALESPTLDAMVDLAYANNPSLQIAAVRVLQAEAQLGIAQGKLYPQQQAISGSVNYQRTDDGLVNSKSSFVSSRIGVGASWEIDFWGKYRRGIESDEAAVQFSVDAYHDALVTLTADVASAFVAIRTLDEQRRIYDLNARTQREALRIARVRYENGETSILDVSQATTRLAETEARIPGIEQQWRQAANTLSLLVGEAPGYADPLLTGSKDVPKPPAEIDVGIPVDLLRRRPDVREALHQAASQSALIGVAESLIYPSFSLSGFFGFGESNFDSSSLPKTFTWQSRFISGGGSFVFPIFNYGRLVNQVRVQDAVFQQAVLNYQNTVLAAQQDVENALASYVYGKQEVDALEIAVVSARRTTKVALDQYLDGQVDFTPVLFALDAQLKVEDALVQSRGSTMLGLISVYRALGGGWDPDAKVVIDPGIANEMRERTNWGSLIPPAKPDGAKDTQQEVLPDAS